MSIHTHLDDATAKRGYRYVQIYAFSLNKEVGSTK